MKKSTNVTETRAQRQITDLTRELELAQKQLVERREECFKLRHQCSDAEKELEAVNAGATHHKNRANFYRAQRDQLVGHIEAHRAFTSPAQETPDGERVPPTWLDLFLEKCTEEDRKDLRDGNVTWYAESLTKARQRGFDETTKVRPHDCY